jgi:predicted nucleic acid-binding protein
VDRVFLDANVLFSAAYGSPRIRTLRERARSGRCRLLASRHTIEEARRNLGDPAHHATLARLLEEVTVVDEAPSGLRPPIAVPDDDRTVFLAALAAGATHFLTGDVRHYGAHFGAPVAGMRIQTPASYLAASVRGATD